MLAVGVDDLLTIGVLAQRCGLSRSALRFYDECGLLPPAAVDGSTGYRYYASSQVGDAILVKRLRAAEMPVSELRQFLAAGEGERREMLQAHADRLEERAGALRRAIGEVLGELDRPGPDERPLSCTVEGRALSSGLSQVMFAAARGEHRPELSGIWLEVRDCSLRLVATDSYRLAIRDLVLEGVTEAVGMSGFVPLGTAGELVTNLSGAGDVTLYQYPSGEMEVVVGDIRYPLGTKHATSFPDYRSVLAGNPAGSKAIVAARELSGALLASADETASIDFGTDAVVVRSGGHQTALEASWDGPPLSVLLNPDFVSEALAQMVGADVIIEASEPLQPVTLRSADTGTLTVLTMPIRPRS